MNLPDAPVRYPHNGRALTDDVVDLFFSLYTNKNVTDKVGPHGDLLDKFPLYPVVVSTVRFG